MATGPVQVRPTASQRSSASESSAKGAGSNFVGYGEDEHFEDDYEGETDDENDEDYSSEESEEEEEGEIIT